jgi:uncharacterized membrane protein (UPF0136 family)
MTAMALLAISRVLVAYFSATGHPRGVTGLVGSALALHVVLLVAMGNTAGGIVRATLIANVALIVVVCVRAVVGRRDQPSTSDQTSNTAELPALLSQNPNDAGNQDQNRPQGNAGQDA